MKTLRTVLVAVCPFFVISLLVSCNKDGEMAMTKTQLLIASPWKQTSVIIDPPIDGVSDFTPTEECALDDLFIFNASGQVTYDQGTIKCDPGQPQTSEGGAWSLNEAETNLLLWGIQFDLDELTASSLKVTQTFDQEDVTYKLTYTFSR